MTKIAVVIPYFQRDAGILRKALQSIVNQDLPPNAAVDVIVVDDSSPMAPAGDLEGLSWPPGRGVRVIKQPNGGPANARNRGLAAVTPDTDMVAFLDSDDAWEPNHLNDAILGLRHGDFYFANTWDAEGMAWFAGSKFFTDESRQPRPQKLEEAGEMALFPSQSILRPLALECLPHTSTVVYNFKRHPAARFDERLKFAGEDHMFWLRASAKSDGVAISYRPSARRGRGVDVYRSALDWDNPKCLRRILYRLIAQKTIRDEFGAVSDKATLAREVKDLREGAAYLLVRNVRKHPLSCVSSMGFFIRHDPLGVAMFPYTVPLSLWRRARGTLNADVFK